MLKVTPPADSSLDSTLPLKPISSLLKVCNNALVTVIRALFIVITELSGSTSTVSIETHMV